MVKVINVLALPYYIICIEIEYNVERRTTARAEQLFTRGYSGIGALRGPQTCETANEYSYRWWNPANEINELSDVILINNLVIFF